MKPISVSQPIDAPPERVFDTISNIQNYQQVIPAIVDVEFLSETKVGVGTKVRESRQMGGTTAVAEFECTEYEPLRRVRLVSDAGGVVWDSVFQIEPRGEHCTLHLSMEARPYRLVGRVLTFFIRGFMVKALNADVEAVRDHFAQGEESAAGPEHATADQAP